MLPCPPMQGQDVECPRPDHMLDEDVLHLVCRHLYRLDSRALRPLSTASKQLRRAALPFMFRHVKVQGDWLESSAVLFRLNEMGMARHVRTFELHIFMRATTLQRKPPDGLPELLSFLLSDMRCLKHLSLDIPSYYASAFGNRLRHDRLILRRVRSVTLAAYCDFVVYLCPNLLSVSTNEPWLLDTRGNPAMRFFAAAGTCMALVEIEAHVDVWTLALMEAASNALSRALIVTLRGRLDIQALTSVLTKWKRVEKLSIDVPADLRASRTQTKNRDREQKTALMLGPQMKALRTLCVGEKRFKILRNVKGFFTGVVME